MSTKYTKQDLPVGTLVKVKGEDDFGVVIENAPKRRFVGVEYDLGNGPEVFDVAPTSVVEAKTQVPAAPVPASTMSVPGLAIGSVVTDYSEECLYMITAWTTLDGDAAAYLLREDGFMTQALLDDLSVSDLPFDREQAEAFRPGSIVMIPKHQKRRGKQAGRLFVIVVSWEDANDIGADLALIPVAGEDDHAGVLRLPRSECVPVKVATVLPDKTKARS